MNDVCEKCGVDLGAKYKTDVKRLCNEHLKAIWIEIQERLKKGEKIKIKTSISGKDPDIQILDPNSLNLGYHLMLIQYAIQMWDVEILTP